MSGPALLETEDLTRAHGSLLDIVGLSHIFPHLTVLENVRVAAQGAARAFNFWSRADRLTEVRDRVLAILETIGLATWRWRSVSRVASR